MNLVEVVSTLENIFAKQTDEGKKRHILFWYDEESDFISDIDELKLENVKILKITDHNYFATKYQLEKEDTASNYLLYAAGPKPLDRDNPLLDMVKYSVEFSADKTTVIMRNLGIKDPSLCSVIKRYRKFFNNKERENAFTSYKMQDYTEDSIDIAVLSVLCKLNMPNLELSMRVLFRGLLIDSNPHWQQVQKFGDGSAFWRLMERYYGYNMPDKSLEKLLVSLMVTGLNYSLEENLPFAWNDFLTTKKADCIIFMNHFMNDLHDASLFNQLSEQIEDKLKVFEYLKAWDADNYLKCDMFPGFDRVILTKLISQLMDGIKEYDRYVDIILARRTLHWYSLFKNEYQALYWAIELFRKQNIWGQEIKQQSCYELFQTYCSDYYTADAAYRRFYTAYDAAVDKDILRTLRDRVENTYVNWFLNELAVKWSNSAAEELKSHWRIHGLIQQKDFYDIYVNPYVNKGERIFVIISDAFRYEAAKEFCEVLNQERKGSTEIFAMQGVLPSCTKLGMASLMPHKAITLDHKNEYFVDEISVTGTDNRDKIMKKYCSDAIALQYEAVMGMSRPKLRQTVQGKKLIYIFHNTIDARGDHGATEREVLRAVDDAFGELKVLINDLVNSVSANLIYLTADHGFLYRRDNLTEADKVVKDSISAAEEKRRYILTRQKERVEGALSISLDYLLGQDCSVYVNTPRGANRFKVQGKGANYVHGGAMPQEIVIPVIKFKNDRSKSGKHEVKKVVVKLTSISRKITSVSTYLDFFQVDKVEEKLVPLRLNIYFVDEVGNRISNENFIIADSKSSKLEERNYREKFTLKSRAYDKRKKYYLVLEDTEAALETIYEKIPFVVDILWSQD